MIRSVENMSNRELISLTRKSFILGFSLGVIGILCFFAIVFKHPENPLAAGVMAIPLLLALLINVMYRKILNELSSRLGVQT
ncbi:MAG TPA: hypothetical protein PKV17_07045 [Aquabacterium sp.]|nr:hypothetical protein [Aquabacterium sp.]HRH28518.1 hypothetical protein [Aquabacterium sp.]